jgi:hypothetical protein
LRIKSLCVSKSNDTEKSQKTRQKEEFSCYCLDDSYIDRRQSIVLIGKILREQLDFRVEAASAFKSKGKFNHILSRAR